MISDTKTNCISQKQLIRRQMISHRKSLSKQQIKECSHCICEKIIHNQDFKNANNIMVYFPTNNEVDIQEIINCAWEEGKTVVFPKVIGKHTMQFYKITNYEQLQSQTYGIMEPIEGQPLFIPMISTLMIVPGLAFGLTKQGIARIGHGGGYYDSYLELYHSQIISYAVGYDFQIIDKNSIIMNSHDQFVNHLITPSLTI